MESTLFDLITSATEMLADRSQPERDLIYAICILDDEERGAIIAAYRFQKEFKSVRVNRHGRKSQKVS